MADTTKQSLQGSEHRISGDATQPGAAMADTDSSGSRQDREQTELWPSSSQQSSGVGGLSREGEDGEVTEERRQFNESRYPLYPPGPGDREGWSQLLSIVPEAQPTFCRTLDGPSAGVDLRLRAVGNGVVPAVAALAFRTLARELKIEELLYE